MMITAREYMTTTWVSGVFWAKKLQKEGGGFPSNPLEFRKTGDLLI